ncbi:MAG: hypothetical protein IPJ65_01895 [Archangiaceae bacterium]|nr:hypothetical protein [Archangiaceae bacterium]
MSVLRAKADGYNKKLRRELGLDDDYVPDATRPPASASRGGVRIGPMLNAGATGVCLSATF